MSQKLISKMLSGKVVYSDKAVLYFLTLETGMCNVFWQVMKTAPPLGCGRHSQHPYLHEDVCQSHAVISECLRPNTVSVPSVKPPVTIKQWHSFRS